MYMIYIKDNEYNGRIFFSFLNYKKIFHAQAVLNIYFGSFYLSKKLG
jgi:hypothetical protein